MQVEQHDVDRLLEHERRRRDRSARLEHAVALELEVDAAEHPQRRVVLDDEHGRRRLSPFMAYDIDFDD